MFKPLRKMVIAILGIALVLTISIVVATSNTKQTTTNLITIDKRQQLAQSPPMLVPPPPTINVKGYILMDANSGTIIAQKNMKQRMSPASLTKMMTLYLTFQALKSGQIKLDDKVLISKKSWKMGGSRMFLNVGSKVPVSLLIQGVVVASGNDACVALAQYIGGSEDTFAQLMNQAAAKLGMKDTHYVDSTGLPRQTHYSTPYDMAILARALIRDCPNYYHYFSQKWLTYNAIKQPNRNRLLWRDPSVDGIKTGHTDAAGYCLVSSALRNNMRLIVVVMGAPTDNARANDSQALINYGFRFYKTRKLFVANQSITKRRIWSGKQKYISFGVKDSLYLTVPTGTYPKLKAIANINKHLRAPIIQGEVYGQLTISLNQKIIKTVQLIALTTDKKGGLWTQFTDRIAMIFNNWLKK